MPITNLNAVKASFKSQIITGLKKLNDSLLREAKIIHQGHFRSLELICYGALMYSSNVSFDTNKLIYNFFTDTTLLKSVSLDKQDYSKEVHFGLGVHSDYGQRQYNFFSRNAFLQYLKTNKYSLTYMRGANPKHHRQTLSYRF
jgi:hypothetical protein